MDVHGGIVEPQFSYVTHDGTDHCIVLVPPSELVGRTRVRVQILFAILDDEEADPSDLERLFASVASSCREMTFDLQVRRF